MASKAIVKARQQDPPPPTSFYRETTIGRTLQQTLDELIRKGAITESFADKILLQFDKAVSRAFSTRVRNKASFKGTLNTYRFCDNVWTMLLDQVVFRPGVSESDAVYADQLRIVAHDVRTSGTEPAESDAADG